MVCYLLYLKGRAQLTKINLDVLWVKEKFDFLLLILQCY